MVGFWTRSRDLKPEREASAMYLENAKHYELRYGVIMANAPRSSGVYALFNGEELLYVGEARNIFSKLIEHLYGGNPILMSEEPTAFAFEYCSAEARTVRFMELVFKWRPPYTERPELKIQED